MRNNFKIIVSIGLLILLTSGCSIKWTEAIRYGSVAQNEVTDTVDVEIHKKLIIVPILISGKKYRFLFDTGAPFSISNQLQNAYNFNLVSKGNIVDSDNNRKEVNWVQVDSIGIGNVLFLNQTAFVGDFKANPVLRCMELDGIIGSNIIRHFNWTIDQEQYALSLSSNNEIKTFEERIVIPFKTDNQFNILIDINIGQLVLKNMLVDYGSNGAIAVNNEIMNTLKDRNILKETFFEKGSKQSGIIGKPVEINREFAFLDSVIINNLKLRNVRIRTGKTASIGNDLLSRFQVTIDWNNKNLYLTKSEHAINTVSLAGFRLGYTIEEGVYVQSVLEHSDAYNKGVRPNMKVVKIDSLDFENGSNFCHYVDHKLRNEIYLQLINAQGQKMEYHVEKTVF